MIYYCTALVACIFFISYIHDRRKIMNGFLFNMLLFFSLASLGTYAFQSDNNHLLFIIGIILLILLFILSFGVFIIMIVSFVNAIILLRKEGRSLSNMLTLFIGIGLLGFLIISAYNWDGSKFPIQITVLMQIIYVFIIYIVFVFMNYFMSSFIYSIYRPRLNKDFIIVLGSGLLEGYRVSPLLARRIDRGLQVYWRQANKKKKKRIPKIIMSGGQGSDEKVSEAQAMCDYAIKQGVPQTDIIMEDQSMNTYENMLFSKKIIDDIKTRNNPQVVFSTSNYHVFRSGIFARKAGLQAQGIGAKTPFYFWYNATIREFIALLVMYKKLHLIMMVGLAIFVIILNVIVNDTHLTNQILQFLINL